MRQDLSGLSRHVVAVGTHTISVTQVILHGHEHLDLGSQQLRVFESAHTRSTSTEMVKRPDTLQ